MEYLKVGKIVSTFGIKGEVKIYVTSSFPETRFSKKSSLLYRNNDSFLELVVEHSHKKDKNFYIVKFKNFDTIEQSEKLINKEILVNKDDSILEENEFFYTDLENLSIFDEDGEKKGIVKKVIDYTPQINLECEYNGKIFYIPFNDFFVKEVNLDKKIIIIHFIEGLL